MSQFEPNDQLRMIRLGRRLSRQRLAASLGISSSTIGRWERGEAIPHPSALDQLCGFFRLSPEELGFSSPIPQIQRKKLYPRRRKQPHTIPAGPALFDPTIPLLSPVGLVGRQELLAQITDRLRWRGNVALTALNGLPGIGKTALAAAVAHDLHLREHFRDGILWAGLGPQPNLVGHLSRWGALLGIPPTEMATLSSITAWAEALRRAIGERSLLLIVDDVWQLEDALTFKVGGENCAHLVTTRFPSIAAQMTADGAFTLQELSEEESLTLLHLLAPGIVEREARKSQAIVHAVGGLPLALTLIGNSLRKYAHHKPARRLAAFLESLTDAEVRLRISEPPLPSESHPGLKRETPLSLQSILSISEQHLNAQARAALYSLSILPPKPDTFSEDTALAVAACTPATLDSLIDAGLLENNGADRYTLHQVIADYARLFLEEGAAHQRLVAYVRRYVERHEKDYEQLEQESSTILTALESAHNAGMQTDLIQIVDHFAPFLILRGFYALTERYLQWASDAAVAQKDSDGRAAMLLYLGTIAQKQGRYEQAEAYLQEGLRLARRAGLDERVCALLVEAGEVCQCQGNYAQAETYLLEGLNLAQRIGDQEQISALLLGLGGVTLRQSKYEQCEMYLQEGLTIARQSGNDQQICGFLTVLGSLAYHRGEYLQAEIQWREGLVFAQRLGDREQACTLLMNLGVVHANQGKFAQAEQYFQEGLLLARQIGHREAISALLANLGDVTSESGNYVQAEAYFQEGLALARQIGNLQWISALLNNLGLMSRRQGNYQQAEAYLQEALALARQIGRDHFVATTLNEYGQLLLDQAQIEAARATFQKMLETIPTGSRELLALAHYGLSRVAALTGDLQRAHQLAEASIAVLEKMKQRNAPEVRDWLNQISQHAK